MNGAILLLAGVACFTLAYLLYSRFIAKAIGVDPERPTPAHTMGDGVDYVPAHPMVLYGHHFAAIAGAGPIIGPVLAAQFGWVSVALWIVLGCMFIGSMHDMVTLFLSVRHQGKSIGTVIEDVLGRPGKMIFLMFSFSALVLVLSVFTGQVADAFVSNPEVATSSLLGIFEAALFGICVYRFRWSVFVASFVFVPLLFFLVWIGVVFPCDLTALFGVTAANARMIWVGVLFLYCFVASTLPVWLLLQPRDYLNSYLLYAMLAIGLTAVFVVCPTINIDAFSGFTVKAARGGGTMYLFPLLFVTVACGACSGFHALVASGTTSKQLDNERHIRPVGYGCMLLEGVVALLALIAVAWHTQADLVAGLSEGKPVVLFAQGLASFCGKLGLPEKTSESFMLLAVAAFLMTSVDACTRLARFVWQELWSTASAAQPAEAAVAEKPPSAIVRLNRNMYFATGVVVAIGVYLLVLNPSMANNLWTMFASANQMLASLTLLTATLWLFKNKLKFWITALPMCFMVVTSGTAVFQLFLQNLDKWMKQGFAAGGVTAIGSITLFCLAVVLMALGALKMRKLVKSRIARSIAGNTK
ncbi:MAG: carbon starvation protein A [Kiritimatiellae bacterium]|nr:carbon starvation protein A [Kiritimatiellia bacterium]